MMSLMTHLVELSEKHRHLESRIAEERARPGCDELKVSRWKRQKLKLKDAIERIRSDNETTH